MTECAICLSVDDEPRLALLCKHDFHADCLEESLRHQKSCPMCRAPVGRSAPDEWRNRLHAHLDLLISLCRVPLPVIPVIIMHKGFIELFRNIDNRIQEENLLIGLAHVAVARIFIRLI